jgi:AcrR family transcriptional regulator
MQEDRPRRASVDRISARSGVSKATIDKWWPDRTAVGQADQLERGGPFSAAQTRTQPARWFTLWVESNTRQVTV